MLHSKKSQAGQSDTIHGLRVESIANTVSENNYMIVVSFISIDGKRERLFIPRKSISSQRSVKDILYQNGFKGHRDPEKWKSILEHLTTFKPVQRVHLVPTTGFYREGVFLLPHKTIGQRKNCRDQYLIDQNSLEYMAKTSENGKINDWKKVAQTVGSSSRMVLALCMAFSGPIYDLVDVEVGGIHFVGKSSGGKSILAKLASSVYGNPADYACTWDTTLTGLEETAKGHNNMLLVMDEIKLADECFQAAARKVSKAVYQLTAGKGKIRSSNYSGKAVPVERWKFTVLSIGELSMTEVAKQGGRPRLTGETVRMVDMPASPDNSRYGVLEEIPDGFDSSSEFMEELSSMCDSNYGTPIVNFIANLLADIKHDRDDAAAYLKNRIDWFIGETGVDRNIGPDVRMAKRFALPYAAGCLAIDYDILPYKRHDLFLLIKACYLSAKGFQPPSDVDVVEQNIRVLSEHLCNRTGFVSVDSLENDGSVDHNTNDETSFVTHGKNGDILAVPGKTLSGIVPCPSTLDRCFKRFLDEGKMVAGTSGKLSRQVRVPGMEERRRFYCFKAEAFPEITDSSGGT